MAGLSPEAPEDLGHTGAAKRIAATRSSPASGVHLGPPNQRFRVSIDCGPSSSGLTRVSRVPRTAHSLSAPPAARPPRTTESRRKATPHAAPPDTPFVTRAEVSHRRLPLACRGSLCWLPGGAPSCVLVSSPPAGAADLSQSARRRPGGCQATDRTGPRVGEGVRKWHSSVGVSRMAGFSVVRSAE